MKTILVVEDSPLIRKAIRRIIEPMGFAVDEAGHGLEALAWLEAGHAPDAILLDVEMPEMDGMTFLKTLRKRAELPQPPVIMCTSVHAVATIAEALRSGADEYIMKPFNEAILGEKLQGVGLVA
jgi:two-component system, chemotaxis family, chemotaxis protein CheY